MAKAKFIVIYGMNNVGKTTQCKNIVNYLIKNKKKAKYFKSPFYNSKSGRKINKLLRSKKQIIPEAEFQKLYAENRFEQQPLLIKTLENNINIVMEDYVKTSLIWGIVKGLSPDYLKKINRGLIKEDIAILLDGNRFISGKEKLHLHEANNILMSKSRTKHLEFAKKYKWKVVDANQSREKVFDNIRKIINQL